MPLVHVPLKLHELKHSSSVTVTPYEMLSIMVPPLSVILTVKVSVIPDSDGLVIRLIAKEWQSPAVVAVPPERVTDTSYVVFSTGVPAVSVPSIAVQPVRRAVASEIAVREESVLTT